MKRRLSYPMRILTLAILLIGLASPWIYSQIKQQLQQRKDEALIAEIKAGDNQRTLQLLAEGANGETRDTGGDHLPALLLLYQLAYESSRDKEPPGPGPDPAVVRALLDHGAKVKDRDAEGESVLYYAAQFTNADVINLLLARGAEVDAKDNGGATPLMFANAETIRVLLEHGADIEVWDNHRETPLRHAVCNDRLEVVRILLEQGATCSLWGDYSDVQAAISSPYPNSGKIEALLREYGPKNGDPDTASFKPLKKSGAVIFTRSVKHEMDDVRFSPDGLHIIIEGYGRAWMCNATTGEKENEEAYQIKDHNYNHYIYSPSSISPDGTRILRETEADGTGLLEVFAIDGAKPLFVLHHPGAYTAYSQNGRYLATTTRGQETITGAKVQFASAGPIVIRDGRTGKTIRKLKSPYKIIDALAFSANGKYLYVGDSEQSGFAGFWDVITGRRLFALNRNIGAWYRFALSPNGRWLCTAAHADSTISPQPGFASLLIWNAQTGALEHKLTGLDKMLYSAAFSRDSRLLATTDMTSSVRIWDTATWKLLRTLNLGEYGEITAAAFSPDGKRLVTSGNYITVWNIAGLAPGKPRP